MRAVILEQNDAEHYIPALEEFRRRHRGRRGIYLIHDGGPSHIAGATARYFDGCHGWWRPRLTPARASWLDQAELLIHAFGDRYLKRSSWPDRQRFITMWASWPEYNERYAHPFEWTWTNQKMRRWFQGIRPEFRAYFVPGTLGPPVQGHRRRERIGPLARKDPAGTAVGLTAGRRPGSRRGARGGRRTPTAGW